MRETQPINVLDLPFQHGAIAVSDTGVRYVEKVLWINTHHFASWTNILVYRANGSTVRVEGLLDNFTIRTNSRQMADMVVSLMDAYVGLMRTREEFVKDASSPKMPPRFDA